MDIKEKILNLLKKQGDLQVADIVEATGFSRVYLSRVLKKMREKDKVRLIGHTNRATYVIPNTKAEKEVKKSILDTQKELNLKGLEEDKVLDDIKKETGIFLDLKENIKKIVEYSFSEILNNAIEHSGSKKGKVKLKKGEKKLIFQVNDFGVGIFNHIKEKRNLDNVLDAIGCLIKGKQTTDPESHSGEGIFFVSRLMDKLIIKSFNKKLVFDNNKEDIFISDINNKKGTEVIGKIDLHSSKKISKVFDDYTDENYSFDKTEIVVNIFNKKGPHMSRSEARRILSGLEKFQRIEFDFKNVSSIGQAFADEIFRVWANKHPDIELDYKNVNENVKFMIQHALNK